MAETLRKARRGSARLPDGVPLAPSADAAPVPASKWKRYTTADGNPYFYNEETNETSWNNPDEDKQVRGGARVSPGAGGVTGGLCA